MLNLSEAVYDLTILIEDVIEDTINLADFADLSNQQLHYLRVITRMKNPTLSELAAELNLTKPTVSVLIDKLEKKGYIRKVKSDADRRSIHIHLDRKAKKINSLRATAIKWLADRITDRLSKEEIDTFSDLLKKING